MDMDQFWRDVQGPFTQTIIAIFMALGAFFTLMVGYYGQKWFGGKAQQQQYDALSSKFDMVKKLAKIVVPSVQKKAERGLINYQDRKLLAEKTMNEITPRDVTSELVDHAIESTVVEETTKAANPPAVLEGEVDVNLK